MTDIQLPPEALYNIGVKAAIIRNGQMLLLCVTRKDNSGVYWDLPGGRIIDGESPEETLRREVTEETGISELTIERPLAMAMSTVRLPLFETKSVGVIFALYVCKTDSTESKPEARIALHWCTIDEAVVCLRSNPDWPEEIVSHIAALR